jgi:hypothetical protein
MARARIKKESYNLRRNDLGDLEPEDLRREAFIAGQTFQRAEIEGRAGNLAEAVNLFFKAAGIGVNVVTTSVSRNIALEPEVIQTMKRMVAQALQNVDSTFDTYLEINGYAELIPDEETSETISGMAGAPTLELARIKLRNARSAYRKGDLRLAVSRALTAALTASKASSGRASNKLVKEARELIQTVAINKLTKRRA